jgi:PEP-CTERM motif
MFLLVKEKMAMSKSHRCLLFGALLLLFSTSAKADGLSLTITNPNQTINYGQLNEFGIAQVSFLGNLSSSSNQQITVGTPGLPCCDPSSFHLEITQQLTSLGVVYNQQFPTTVDALANINNLNLFTINVPLWTNAPAHTITGIFTVNYYLPGGDVQSISKNISIDVPAGIPVPEPATLTLLATGVVGFTLRKHRGRRLD